MLDNIPDELNNDDVKEEEEDDDAEEEDDDDDAEDDEDEGIFFFSEVDRESIRAEESLEGDRRDLDRLFRELVSRPRFRIFSVSGRLI